ncbi:sugar ABC transporter substrate-binding protein [Streptococcus suis]|uniref:Periplasmic sugar-binding protein n=1 Tax=Streptococcus suis TaxID=1307 RepID=A0A0Z8JJ64_STRSU|nr:substrate-binding domain-containing protein [Streptococcus suis]MBM0273090.1 substrate-binding domain-containing protein [Streptococcus suis]NQG71096.1 sugar ABC transporter substrate-binding protein [Streptococcus suis]NQP04584.1 sugar ABC transporter substrate-binding protein [Streptococcus suis]NRH15656.1 sugar ABC transporter substrate-binding protein [Streptococcus suis]UUM59848.1 substrate-binding domain-containing protein [Streptococcus suis]
MKNILKQPLFFCYTIGLIVLAVNLFGFYKNSHFSTEQVKIGVTYMTMNNDFYQVLNDEIEKEVLAKGDKLILRDPALDVSKQVQQVQSFINQGVDVIIINPVDSNDKALIAVLKQAKEAGLGIVVVDSQLKDADFVDTTILSDNYQAGVLCAQHLLSHRTEADILLLEHASTVSGSERIQGFLDTIESHESYRVVARKEVQGQTEIAMPAVQEVLRTEIAFDTVMALNDKAALGALAALEEEGIGRDVSIYGIDGSPDMKNLLATTSDVQATVAQTPYAMGAEVVKASYSIMAGKKLDTVVLTPVTLLDQEIIQEYDVTGWQ